MDSEQLLVILRRFAATMARRFEINDVLDELAEHAASILGAAGAGVSVVTDTGRLGFVTATSDRITRIEQVQDEHQAGACVEAFHSGRPAAHSSLAELARWPGYQQAIRDVGLGAVVGLPLIADGHRIGSLNVYDHAGREWSADDLAAAQVLADIAAAYLVRAGELAEARELSAQLQRALDSRVVIEQAKGMLSRDHGIPVDQAFELLRQYCRSTNSNLRRLAEQIVHEGFQLPTGRA